MSIITKQYRHKIQNVRLKLAIAALLKFHPESPETGAELPAECWTEDYRKAVLVAAKLLNEAP